MIGMPHTEDAAELDGFGVAIITLRRRGETATA